MEEIILLGIGGHAHSVVDSIEQSGKYRIIGFLDIEERKGLQYKEYKVIGTDDMLEQYFRQGVRNAFVTVGYMGHGSVRKNLYFELKRIGYQIPNIIDNTAVLAKNIIYGEGNFIGKQAIVNAGAQIGDMCILNSGSVVEHDCKVGSFSHLAVGSVLCGGARIGEETFVGANAVVIQEISVGSKAIIGAGTIITRDVSDEIIKYGAIERKRE